MNERQLHYFLIAAREKNLRKATEILPLSLSALSRQIQSLEEELEVELFERSSAGLILTKAGECMFKHTESLLQKFTYIKNDVKKASVIHNRVEIGGYGSAMLNHIPEIIKKVKSEDPTIEVIIHSAPIEDQFKSLKKGVIQIAFDRFFETPEGISKEIVYSDTICVALPADHPLTALDEVHIDDLRDMPMIGRLNSNNTPSPSGLIGDMGFEPNIVQRALDMVSAVSLTSVGIGLSLVPESLKTLTIPNVTFRPISTDLDLSFNLYCYYRSDDISETTQRILNIVNQYPE